MGAAYNRKLEGTGFPTEELTDTAKEAESIADSLSGIISDPGMTLDELREERLKKYDD